MTLERIIELGCPADLAPLAFEALEAIRNFDGAPVSEARKELALTGSLRSFDDPVWDEELVGPLISRAAYEFAWALRKRSRRPEA